MKEAGVLNGRARLLQAPRPGVSNEAAAAVGVLIVDDSAPFRRAARDVVAATPGFEVVGEAASGEEALSALEELDPCLVLLDVTMGGIDGIETARRITAGYPRPTVVLISVNDPAGLPSRVEACGAVAFVDKRDFRPALLADLWDTHGRRGDA